MSEASLSDRVAENRSNFSWEYVTEQMKKGIRDEIFRDSTLETAKEMEEHYGIKTDWERVHNYINSVEWKPHKEFMEEMYQWVEAQILVTCGWEYVLPQYQDKFCPCEGAGAQCSFLCRDYGGCKYWQL